VELRDLLQKLWRRRLAVLGALVVATIAASAALFRLDLGIPPKAETRAVESGTGVMQVVLNSPAASIYRPVRPLEALTNRAAVYATFVQSPPVVERTAAIMGLEPEDIAARGAPPAGITRGREIDADQRATELTAESASYRIYAVPAPDAPVITLYVRAPEPASAVRLAKASVQALREYVVQAEESNAVPADERVSIMPLGEPQAGWINKGARYMIAALAFVAALLAWTLLLTFVGRLRRAVAVERARSLLAGAAPPRPATNGSRNGTAEQAPAIRP
jgi:hypothetical protein